MTSTRHDTPPDGLPFSVLLVDDVQEFREMYSRFFAFKGAGVSTAIDGREALEIARLYPPDVIVLDLSMPGMNGWEFLHAARHDERLRRIPVVVVTAYGSGQTESEARALGASSYVSKPCLPEHLLQEVRRVAQHKR